MFVYIIYNIHTLDIHKIFLDEDDVIDYFTSFELSTCSHYDWKAINLDALFKLYKNEFIKS